MSLRFKKMLGVLYPFIIFFLTGLLLLSLSRLGLSIWQAERVNEANGWLPILLSGLRVDVASLSLLLILPAIFSCFLLQSNTLGRVWGVLLRLYFVLLIWLLVYMELATTPFILEYDVRPNRLFVEYLKYPQEVFAMLWSGYKLELFVGFVGSVLSIYFGWKFAKAITTDLHYPKWYWRPVLMVLVLLVMVMGARSTLGHRPLNPAMVAFSTDPLMNDLALNSTYSVGFAIRQMRDEVNAFKFYGKMPEEEIIARVRQSTVLPVEAYYSKTTPTLARHIASYKGKPKNFVIFLHEILGPLYFGGLGGMPLTPNMDGLMKEGWSFDRAYSTGTRSVRGIEAVVTGFSPTPGRAVVKLGKSQSGFFTIAQLLKQKGYVTQFIYGGESHFDNMKGFFLGNGFTNIHDFQKFKQPEFVGSWGASDEDLYKEANQQFEQLNQQGKPFFSLVFSSSNHSPFDFPENKIELYNQPKSSRENAAKYSDYALGKFFKAAKKSSYWDNTIFLVIADHDSRAYGNELVPIDHFHIPAFVVGNGVPVKKDQRLVSQIDMPPTLLSLIGISSDNPMIGHDLTGEIDEAKLRAMMQFFKNFAWMNNKNEVVVYQPQRKAQGFFYHSKTGELEAAQVDAQMALMAKANALWGALSYQKGMYSSREIK